MKRQNPFKALLWLLLIPAQLILGFLFVFVGVIVDGKFVFSMAEKTAGHPMPTVSLIFAMLAIVATVFVICVSILLTVIRFLQICRSNRKVER
jgi:hypothetical protein